MPKKIILENKSWIVVKVKIFETSTIQTKEPNFTKLHEKKGTEQ